MSSRVARWLRRLARWCERLADDLDSHQHVWRFHTGTYGQQTCLGCGRAVVWPRTAPERATLHTPVVEGYVVAAGETDYLPFEPPTKAPPAPGDTGVAYFQGFENTELDEFGHHYGH